MDKQNKTNSRWFKSPWVLAWLLLVIIVLTVNIYMIIQSKSNFAGLVVDDFYDRGQDYEENIHIKLANNEKWNTRFYLDKVYHNKPAIIKFNIKDKQNKPLIMDKIKLYIYRPADAKQDFSVDMVPAEVSGTYQSTVTFTLKGEWDLLASIKINGTEVNYGRRLFVYD
ncbi:MAG: FixH family protein [Gammaproteobacteria bacterium]|nr:FixH family protein [Gammaproteobacteria bacterium]